MNMTKEEDAKSTYAYTPGLKVKRNTLVRKRRMLPVLGKDLVTEGETVSFDTVVARTTIRGIPHISRTSSVLGVDPDEVEDFIVKKIGENIEKGEILAKYSGFFGLFDRKCYSPATGRIESVSKVTGCVIVREPDILVNLDAYIPGKVIKVFPGEGVEIETNAVFIQGIFGVGGETHGELKLCVETNEDILTADDIHEECNGKMLVGGSQISKDALKRAVDAGAAGIIAGGIDDKVLMDFLGYEIGVAITGQEDIPITIIITEGFGKISMSSSSFLLMKDFEGYMVSATGETQIRAGVMRPEIIIPHPPDEKPEGSDEDMEGILAGGMKIGTQVRVIREPYFGAIGKITYLPVQLQKVQTESHVRVMEIELQDGRKVIVPRANVEIIEE